MKITDESRPKVLIVDDFEELRQLIGLYISGLGIGSDLAENGLVAYEKARGGCYDVILMDIQMPQLSGVEVLKKLRAENYTKPVVALTAHTTEEDRSSYLSSGFDGFLGKPFTIDELKEVLDKFIYGLSRSNHRQSRLL